jgi:hypothetical protein
MKTKIKATASFMHGRIRADAGDELEVTKGEADEMVKAGLVQIVNDEQAAQSEQPAETQQMTAESEPAQSVEAKMAEAPENKMEDVPENKAEASDEDKPAAGKAARKTAGKKAD